MINDNLEEQAKALFKSWFVDFDRNEWVHCELGDITLITAGGDRPSKYTNKKTIECHVPIYSHYCPVKAGKSVFEIVET